MFGSVARQAVPKPQPQMQVVHEMEALPAPWDSKSPTEGDSLV